MEITLKFNQNIGTEGFRITDSGNGGIVVIGNDELGLLYGLGKLLRTSFYSEDGFTLGSWRGESIPEKPIRGIYFASHFGNYYHVAPIKEVKQYVEELGLWGINSILIWYDMHHFKGFNSPEAIVFRERIDEIFRAAKDIGMQVGLINVANEGYDNSPEKLRVDGNVHRGGFYQSTICPEKSYGGQSGMDYILKTMEEEFDWIASFEPKHMAIWPYDQGGCGCEKCSPWGSNGFMRTGSKIAALARKKLPDVEIIASTWFMNKDEREGVSEYLKEKDSWADIIIVGNSKINDLPLIGFPEISMSGMFPWGGFGAHIMAARLERGWNGIKDVSSGGFPYSEGIYEDISKIVYSHLLCVPPYR